jgi:hypothetical protein
MSLITGNKVKKPHKPRYCEKEKDNANKIILRSLSFDNNGLVKPSCGTVALYGPFVFFLFLFLVFLWYFFSYISASALCFMVVVLSYNLV